MLSVRPLFATLAAAGLLAAQGQPPLAQRIAAHLRANDLKADVSFLASDALQGRATPSPGLDMAAEYIAAQFRRAGLEPVGDDGYFQNASYQSVIAESGWSGIDPRRCQGGISAPSAFKKLWPSICIMLPPSR